MGAGGGEEKDQRRSTARDFADTIILRDVKLLRNDTAPLRSSRATGCCKWHKEKQPSSDETNNASTTLTSNVRQVGRMLSLLREYQERFGMPTAGGKVDQEIVLKQLTQKLCSSGVPLWVVETYMTLAAQGLLGIHNVHFYLRPRDAAVALPTCTRFFRIQRGLALFHLNLLERVLLRIASFATNNGTAVSTEFKEQDLREVYTLLRKDLPTSQKQEKTYHHCSSGDVNREELANQILDLSARGYGLFFMMDVKDMVVELQIPQNDTFETAEIIMEGESSSQQSSSEPSVVHPFWKISELEQELFTRLATIEAAECLAAIDRQPGPETRYPRYVIVFYRMINAGASSVLWFGGSWKDMAISSILSGLVALFLHTNSHLWSNHRMIFEVVTGFLVGLIVGLVSLFWPNETCFNAIGVAVMIDYLRGFGAAFSVMEVMSKHTLTGAADLVEAIVFSTLIAANMVLGLYVAELCKGVDPALMESDKKYLQCLDPIDETWYILLVPLASIAWAASFNPSYADIPLMAFHAVLAFGVSYGMEKATDNSYFGLLIASFALAVSAGLFSRVTGRQSLTDIFCGLYALVPGIFAVSGVFAYLSSEDHSTDFIVGLIVRASIIGTGVWMGTLICAPTYMVGTRCGQLFKDEKTMPSVICM